jgi:hypothetical protein
MILTVAVEYRHIERAVKRQGNMCPVAIALREVCPAMSNCCVGYGGIFMFPGKCIPLPRDVSRWVSDFDNPERKVPMKPITFTLQIGADVEESI